MVSRIMGGFVGGDVGLLIWWGIGVDFWLWIVDVEFGIGVYWIVYWYIGWMVLCILFVFDCWVWDCVLVGMDVCIERGWMYYRCCLLIVRRDVGVGINFVVEVRDDYWLLFVNLVLVWFWWWMYSKCYCVYYGFVIFRIWIWYLCLGYCVVDCGGEWFVGN